MSIVLLCADDSEQNHSERSRKNDHHTMDLTSHVLQAYFRSLIQGKMALADALYELWLSFPISLN